MTMVHSGLKGLSLVGQSFLLHGLHRRASSTVYLFPIKQVINSGPLTESRSDADPWRTTAVISTVLKIHSHSPCAVTEDTLQTMTNIFYLTFSWGFFVNNLICFLLSEGSSNNHVGSYYRVLIKRYD